MRTARFIGLFLLSAASAVGTLAQTALKQKEFVVESPSGGGAMYFAIFIVLLGLGGAYFFWNRSRKGIEEQAKEDTRYKNDQRDENSLDVDAAQELEWFRQAKKSARDAKKPSLKFGRKRPDAVQNTGKYDEADFDTRLFQERMRMLQYAQLPINSFSGLTPSKSFDPLPESNDRSLLTAIEQAYEEDEEDEAIRELAVRVLAAFRTRNSVEALAQIAIYDLSANIRSKAVSVLTDFDHESVFDTILLACADPTREVRAAAARGLFRLNFDRSDAWKRLIETNDDYRMSHAVRAAIEAGIVQKSLERLVHEDMKIAYEAFTLVSLMIKSGETKEVIDAIRDHKDERVKFALLHVIKVTGDPRPLIGLTDLLVANHQFSDDVVKRINDVVNSFERVAV